MNGLSFEQLVQAGRALLERSFEAVDEYQAHLYAPVNVTEDKVTRRITPTCFVMGPACAGKSTFLAGMKKACEEAHLRIGLIQVGQELRKRYPPDYFAGKMAPAHTQEEAWGIAMSQCAEALKQECFGILCDGQPRSIDQVDAILKGWPCLPLSFLYLTAPAEIRLERARSRFANDPGSFALAEARIKNDMIDGHEVLTRLRAYDMTVHVIDTSIPGGPEAAIGHIVDQFTATWQRELNVLLGAQSSEE